MVNHSLAEKLTATDLLLLRSLGTRLEIIARNWANFQFGRA